MYRTPRNITARFRVLAALIMLALAVSCGPGPKSQQLDDLERQLQDDSANEVKNAPGADKPYREARQYRRLSLESWDQGKDEISAEYAILGMLRYRTAAAIYEQHEAKARLDQANTKVSNANPEIRALNEEQLKLAAEVNELELQAAQARRTKEEAERRRKALASQAQAATGSENDAAKAIELRNKLREVATARNAADAVNAAEHAPEKYNPAANTQKSVEALSASGGVNDDMIAEAQKAVTLFQEATAAAKPQFQVAQDKLDPALRRRNLTAAAESDFGTGNVVAEASGVRIVLPGSFAKGASTVNADQSNKLNALVTLAKSFDEFSIAVEGYTSKGDATENLGLSQIRARNVATHLTSNGVKASRVETRGQGQDRPRFGSSSTQNDRVEVVFTR